MFDNIAGITTGTTATKKVVNQIDTLMETAKNRVGQRDALQQWINKNVLNMPTLPESDGRAFTIQLEYQRVSQSVSDTLWTIALLSIQQQGYTSTALLSAVTATSINKSAVVKVGESKYIPMESQQSDWKLSSNWILNTLVKKGMVEMKVQEMETPIGKRNQTLFFISPNWSKAHLNPIIEDMRENVSIVCKPLEFCPPNWMEGEQVQQRTKLQLVSSKADTLVKCRVGKKVLSALNSLQNVGYEVAEGHEADIYNILDAEKDEAKRNTITELISLQNKRFFFPVSLDYRGRIYYRGGSIHPQAQKEIRQFLNFSESELVNRLDAIGDLATALEERENPVQRRELERLEGMTQTFVQCKVVVNYDGCANGLQHQSVMLRSKKLASLTKLVVEGYVEEVYKHVTNVLVKEGFNVTRKFCKRVIMTASYGATKGTQIAALMEVLPQQEAQEAYEVINRELPELKEYTNFVSSRCMQMNNLDCTIETGDGFTMQFRKIDRTESTRYAGVFSAIVGKEFIEDPEATARACAPNIVHANDSAHLRSVVRAWTGNISTIHDSIGCVAGRGREMKKLILSTFKELHQTDIINEWAKSNNVSELNTKGSLKLSDIDNIDMFC